MEKLTINSVIWPRLRSSQSGRFLKGRWHVICLISSFLRRNIIRSVHLIAIIIKRLNPLCLTLETRHFRNIGYFSHRRIKRINIIFLTEDFRKVCPSGRKIVLIGYYPFLAHIRLILGNSLRLLLNKVIQLSFKLVFRWHFSINHRVFVGI